ncbi:capsular biosynthesis protein [Staphylococcus simulans]|nr:capsular biosynthesis protein [Staphylococcus simulans]PTJ02687.1 capsular biosynthesis protein [Staphylococcus simulans]PTJ09323.1 capsular biosynthesis protein [Staphylococcus simulans]PTJ38607.1 capsular biosynthesis protein [Staphylococcus simulans]PTJ95609.1 capsular biosynthesis protein [Staphylococcus simulans]
MLEKKNIPFSPPDINSDDIKNVIEVLESGWITTGPQTKTFENEIAKYVGTDKAVCLNSCTAALEMTLRTLEVGQGDEVIVPAYTYTATAAAAYHTGATIKMVDSQHDSIEMDYQQLADMITEKTKVIIAVDIAGKPIDYDKLFDIVKAKRSLFKPKNSLQAQFERIIVIADAAHSFGAEYKGKKVGQLADFTCFSFHAVKNLTTGEGGAVTWLTREKMDNESLYKKYMLLSLHGQSKDALSKSGIGQWEYDIIAPLYKCNMTDIQASIGRSQLDRYHKILSRRREIIKLYQEEFQQYENVNMLNHLDTEALSSGHLLLTRVTDINLHVRNEIIKKMGERGIACNVHYKPLPLLTAYKNLGFNINDYPNAYSLFENEISLPLHTKLSDEEVRFVAQNFIDVINEVL